MVPREKLTSGDDEDTENFNTCALNAKVDWSQASIFVLYACKLEYLRVEVE